MIPERIAEGLKRYEEDHIPPGGFLRACLENNLLEAVRSADLTNAPILADIMRHIHYNLPGKSWGSRDKVRSWLNARVEDPDQKTRWRIYELIGYGLDAQEIFDALITEGIHGVNLGHITALRRAVR